MSIAEARIAERAEASPPWSDMEAFVAQLKAESEPLIPAWAHSPCDAGEPNTYSFDACEVAVPSPNGATAFVRATGDYHPVDPNDIRQGRLGDCYLLSSLAALARDGDGREILRRSITETVRDGQRAWDVTLRVPLSPAELACPHDGRRPWREVHIEVPDRFLPSAAQVGDVRGGTSELWPRILEAAIAKYRTCFDAAGHAGYARDVLPLLTGERAAERPVGELWAAHASGSPVVVGVGEYVGTPPYGLVASHAYSVDRVYVDDHGRRMVQLRNPWGQQHPAPIPIDAMAKSGMFMTTCPPPKP